MTICLTETNFNELCDDMQLNHYQGKVKFSTFGFYKQNNWRVGLNFKNLFDINYYVETQGREVVYPGAPFTVIGSVSFTF